MKNQPTTPKPEASEPPKDGSDLSAAACSEKVVKEMVESEDHALKSAISARIGSEWSIEDIKHRLKRLSYRDHPGEIITLDEKPIMEIFPVECKVEQRGDRTFFTANRPFRIFKKND